MNGGFDPVLGASSKYDDNAKLTRNSTLAPSPPPPRVSRDVALSLTVAAVRMAAC